MRPSEVLIQLRARPRVRSSFYKKMARVPKQRRDCLKMERTLIMKSGRKEASARSWGEMYGEASFRISFAESDSGAMVAA